MTQSQATTTLVPADDAPLTRGYVHFAAAVAGTHLLEFFDFFTIGYVVAMISGPWHLTFTQSAIILLGTGGGTIIGALLWGWIGDRFGRRTALILAILVFSLGTGISALTPTGWWWLLALFRFIVGMGTGGGNVSGPPLLVEFTPARYRTIMSGIATVSLVPVGGLLVSAVVAAAAPALGFRGLLLVGLVPTLSILWVLWAVPESSRWLAGRGRYEEARTSIARLFGSTWLKEIELPQKRKVQRNSYASMRHYPKALLSVALLWLFTDTIFAGVGLWAPTLLAQIQQVTPQRAAQLFIIVTIAGFTGRILCPFLAHRVGRRVAGIITGIGGGILLALAGILQAVSIGQVSLFLIFLTAGYLFADGIFTNLVPFTAEIWPVELRARGQGLGNAFGGVGKIIGPLVLALFAGSSNFVEPAATSAAALPAFVFFGVFILLTALVFATIAPEPNRRSLEAISGEASRQESTETVAQSTTVGSEESGSAPE